MASPASPASFRVPADVVEGWKDALSADRAVKGVEPVLKELLDALLAQSPDGYVAVERHKVFSWAEAVRGASTRAPDGAKLAAVADEMRSHLAAAEAGKGPPAGAAAAAAAAGPAVAPATAPGPAPATAPAAGQGWAASYVPPPAVVYTKAVAPPLAPAGATASASMRLVTERDLAGAVAQLLREATQEVVVVAPWNGGLDVLVKDLLVLPRSVGLRVLTRRAQPEDEAWHRALQDLQRRGVDLVISPLLYTRCVIVDGRKLLLGAAGAPANVGREMALLVEDANVAGQARANVGRLWQEARDGR